MVNRSSSNAAAARTVIFFRWQLSFPVGKGWLLARNRRVKPLLPLVLLLLPLLRVLALDLGVCHGVLATSRWDCDDPVYCRI